MLTQEQAAIVKGLLDRGEKQHDIAAFFSINGGRIAEIAKGARFRDVKPALKRDLPLPSDVAGNYAVYVAEQAINRARLALDVAMAYLQDCKSGADRGHS